MSQSDINIAIRLLTMTASDQKAERPLGEFLSTMVKKYGERGYVVAPDEVLHDLFVRLYESPGKVTTEDGPLCLAIMRCGLKQQLLQGWKETEIADQVVFGYAERLHVTETELRTFVHAALA